MRTMYCEREDLQHPRMQMGNGSRAIDAIYPCVRNRVNQGALASQ